MFVRLASFRRRSAFRLSERAVPGSCAPDLPVDRRPHPPAQRRVRCRTDSRPPKQEMRSPASSPRAPRRALSEDNPGEPAWLGGPFLLLLLPEGVRCCALEPRRAVCRELPSQAPTALAVWFRSLRVLQGGCRFPQEESDLRGVPESTPRRVWFSLAAHVPLPGTLFPGWWWPGACLPSRGAGSA